MISLTLLNRIAKCDTDYARSQMRIGAALSKKGDSVSAISCRAIECDPKSVMDNFGIGVGLFSVVNIGEAFAAFRRAKVCDLT